MTELVVVSHESIVLNATPVFLGVLHVVSNALGNPSITIPPTERQFLHNLVINSQDTFHEIDNALQSIMSDCKIDYHDIPQIILIISTIFKNLKYPTCVDLVVVIQILLDTILDSGLLPIPAFEIVILKRVVDASLGLLKTNLVKIPAMVTYFENGRKTRTSLEVGNKNGKWNCCS